MAKLSKNYVFYFKDTSAERLLKSMLKKIRSAQVDSIKILILKELHFAI